MIVSAVMMILRLMMTRADGKCDSDINGGGSCDHLYPSVGHGIGTRVAR